MEKPERQHETRIPYIIDTPTGSEEGFLDLAKLSLEELDEYAFTLPQAADELLYRQLLEYLGIK